MIDSISSCLQVKGDLSGIPVMLVGNKSDEESGKREVAEKTGQALQVTIHFDNNFQYGHIRCNII